MKVLLVGGALLLLTSGCNRPTDARHPEDAVATESGGRHEPASPEERAILERVADLPVNVREKVGDRTLTASRTYHAASGYSCRTVTIEDAQEQVHRLACGDDDGWFFVPDVYHQGVVVEPPSEPVVRISPTGEATVVDGPVHQSTVPNSSASAPEEEGL